mmetsp:Transcript_70921/g.114356  ORF Transcript_70921/g.114356 Transcript_70921/m.114356 type:complete len:590 (+) Transcript_70921:2032-3801(+)
MTSLALETNASCLVHVLGHQRVAKGEEEGHTVLRLLRFDQVEQPGGTLRRVVEAVHVPSLLLDLLHANAGGAAKILASDELDHCLSVLGGLHHNCVQHGAGSRDSDIVLLVDGAQVAEAAIDALEPTSLGLLIHRLDETASEVLLFELRARLLGLHTGGLSLLGDLLHLSRDLTEALLGITDQLDAVLAHLGGILALELADAQALAALRVFALQLLDLIGDLHRLLAKESGLCLRHLDDLLHLCELLLQRNQFLLLGLFGWAESLGLALEACEELLQLGSLTGAEALSAVKLLLTRRGIDLQLLSVLDELHSLLPLALCSLRQLLEFLLMEGNVLREFHIQALELFEIQRALLHLLLDLVVVAKVGVVLALDRFDLLFEAFHLQPVPLHVGLQGLVLLFKASMVGLALLGLSLRQQGLQLQALGFCSDPGLSFLARSIKRLFLALSHTEAIQLLLSLLSELLYNSLRLFDGLQEAVRANDVLQILQQAILVRSECLGLHQRDLLDLSLQDEEAVVLEVHPSRLEQRGDVSEVAELAIQVVLGGVVLEGLTADCESCALEDLIVLRTITRVPDVLEGDLHLCTGQVRHGP